MIIIDGQEILENIEKTKNSKISKIKYVSQFLMKLLEVFFGLFLAFYFFILLQLYLLHSECCGILKKYRFLIVIIIFIISITVILLKSFKYLFKYDKNYIFFSNIIKILELLEPKRRRIEIKNTMIIILIYILIIFRIITLISEKILYIKR